MPEAIVVSDLETNVKMVGKIPVISLEMLDKQKDCAIIVTVGKRFTNEVKQKLISGGFNNFICYVDI